MANCNHIHQSQNSIMGSVNTGYGFENSLLFRNQPCNTTVLHLCKEAYLSEFQTEQEKAQARFNLGVLSDNEVDRKLNLKLNNYVTKDALDQVVAGSGKLQNYYTKEEIDSMLENSNLDNIPTNGSANGVTSDGVWQYIDGTVGNIHRYIKTI